MWSDCAYMSSCLAPADLCCPAVHAHKPCGPTADACLALRQPGSLSEPASAPPPRLPPLLLSQMHHMEDVAVVSIFGTIGMLAAMAVVVGKLIAIYMTTSVVAPTELVASGVSFQVCHQQTCLAVCSSNAMALCLIDRERRSAVQACSHTVLLCVALVPACAHKPHKPLSGLSVVRGNDADDDTYSKGSCCRAVSAEAAGDTWQLQSCNTSLPLMASQCIAALVCNPFSC